MSTLPSPTAEALQTAPLDGLFASAELASETLERPPLRKTDTADSGYSSGKRSTSPKLHPFDQIDSRIATFDFPNDIPYGDLGPPGWAFNASQATLNHAQRNAVDPRSSAVDELTGKLGGWSNTGSGDIPWWSGDTINRPSAASLISAAKALEDQAQSLRDLASQHNAGILDQNRRSTIALPVTQDPAYPAIDVPSNTVGPLDDMALLFATRSLSASGLQRQPDFSWYFPHTDNYASFSNHQLPALQSQAPHLENATHVGYTNTNWNLAPRSSNQASGGDFLVTAQEQLVEQRRPFRRTQGNNSSRSAMMEQPDCSYTWPER